ncbi:hypothetical protein [Streptosporangium sp. NPDC051022]|uniref:hypothetical protein n=1 Tax=Streptosporangium sp. NPDC051022 TaxID=3155752 RepID=UPI00341E8194
MKPLPEPTWLADAPYAPPEDGGSHWTDCERVHPGCAYRLGRLHGRQETRPATTDHDPDEALDRAVLAGACTDEASTFPL